jgi:hypothetical protein
MAISLKVVKSSMNYHAADTDYNEISSSSFPFPFVPLQRRGCLVAPWFL